MFFVCVGWVSKRTGTAIYISTSSQTNKIYLLRDKIRFYDSFSGIFFLLCIDWMAEWRYSEQDMGIEQ